MSLLRKIGEILYFIYQWLVYVPIMAVITLLTALVTMLMCAFFDDRVWGFYPAKAWARLMCYLAFVRVKVVELSLPAIF